MCGAHVCPPRYCGAVLRPDDRQAQGKTGPAPEIILAHMCALADTVDTHPDRTRVPLEWSTALRDEVWPLFLQFQETVIATVAQTIRRLHLSRRAIEPKPLGRVRADCR